MSTDEIKPVDRVYSDCGDYMVRCPHCYAWITLEGDDLSEILGEQYHHASILRGCDGWLEVLPEARYAGRVPNE